MWWGRSLDRTLGVIGVGLIGGSIGLAARGAGWEVVGVDEPRVLERAQTSGAIGRSSTLKEVRGADLVVLAAPISRVATLVEDLAPTDALTTDVASAKGAIVRAARAGLRFVGGHPMAGSQLSGVANARADLFRGARYFLTPTDRTDPEDYRKVSVFVRASAPYRRPWNRRSTTCSWRRSPTCRTSWPPHSSRSPRTSPPKPSPSPAPPSGTSRAWGRRTPPSGAGHPGRDTPALGEALGAFAGAMAQLGSEIQDKQSMKRRFLQAREAYDALGGILVEKSGENVDLAIPVENRPGVFAEVTTLMGSNDINILDLYVRHSNTERAALVLTLDAGDAGKARDLLLDADFGAEIEG